MQGLAVQGLDTEHLRASEIYTRSLDCQNLGSYAVLPTILPNGKRIPGLKLDHPRQLALMPALVRFAHIAAANTFTTQESVEILGSTSVLQGPRK